MYFNSFGGSALLHLLAGHPRVVAAFGIAGTVAILVSPLGPGKHPGSEAYAQAIDQEIPSSAGLNAATVAQAATAAEQLSHMSKDAVHEAVVRVNLEAVNPERMGTKAAVHYEM